MRDYRKRDYVKVKKRAYERNRPVEKALFYSAKARAKKLGLEFSLDKEDIIIPEHCPVLGLPLSKGVGERTNNSPSIDRINPSKGYTKDNVIIVCWLVNKLKADAPISTLQKIVEYYNGMV